MSTLFPEWTTWLLWSDVIVDVVIDFEREASRIQVVGEIQLFLGAKSERPCEPIKVENI